MEELAHALPAVAGTQLKALLVPDVTGQRQSLDQLKLISDHVEKSPVLNYRDKNLFCLVVEICGWVCCCCRCYWQGYFLGKSV